MGEGEEEERDVDGDEVVSEEVVEDEAKRTELEDDVGNETTYACVCVCVSARAHARMRACIRAFAQRRAVFVCVCVCVCVCSCVRAPFALMYVCMCMYLFCRGLHTCLRVHMMRVDNMMMIFCAHISSHISRHSASASDDCSSVKQWHMRGMNSIWECC